MKKIIGWLLFAIGIPYVIIAPIVVKMLINAGNTIFGGMSLQIGIAIFIMGIGWILAHPKKRQE